MATVQLEQASKSVAQFDHLYLASPEVLEVGAHFRYLENLEVAGFAVVSLASSKVTICYSLLPVVGEMSRSPPSVNPLQPSLSPS